MLTKACGETIRLSACLSTEQVSMKQEAQKLQLWVAHARPRSLAFRC